MATDFTWTNTEKVDKVVGAVVELRTTVRLCLAAVGLGLPLIIGLLTFLVVQSFSIAAKVDRLSDRIDNKDPLPANGQRLTEAQVLLIAEKALKAKMTPEYVDKYQPYRAELRGGFWHVFGTLPGGGAGGTPEASVKDNNGEVIQVFHSQ